MQVINKTGNANQKSRVRKELRGYFVRVQGLRDQSKRVLSNLQNSVDKKRTSQIGAVALSNGERYGDAL